MNVKGLTELLQFIQKWTRMGAPHLMAIHKATYVNLMVALEEKSGNRQSC